MKSQALMISQSAYIKDLEERLNGMPDVSYHQEAVERLKREIAAKDD
jgi:predicted DNA-binding protein